MADKNLQPKPKKSEIQAESLAKRLEKVRVHSFDMKRAVDKSDLKGALKQASLMISALQTGDLSPKKYYELYMAVFDELNFLEMFFRQLTESSQMTVESLYQMVQHASSVLTRMYLLTTAGAVYIRSKESPASEVLYDILGMVKSVQYPTRGLFLRYYVCQKSRSLLPDEGSEYMVDGTSVPKSIRFLLRNFAEMNRLWVRMQHSHHIRSKRRRERERRELKTLVGTSLVMLSQMDGVTLDRYCQLVLPPLLREVILCHDPVAQQYILDAMIQVFPAEYQAASAGALLSTLEKTRPSVEVVKVIMALLERMEVWVRDTPEGLAGVIVGPGSLDAHALARPAADGDMVTDEPLLHREVEIGAVRDAGKEAAGGGEGGGGEDESPDDIAYVDHLQDIRTASRTIFELLREGVAAILQKHPSVKSPGQILDAMLALAKFVIASKPQKLRRHLNQLLGVTIDGLKHVAGPAVAAAAGDNPEESPLAGMRLEPADMKKLVALIGEMQAVLGLDVLRLEHCPPLLAALDFENRRSVSVKMVQAVLTSHKAIDNEALCKQLLQFIATLIRDDKAGDAVAAAEEDPTRFAHEQRLVGRLVHLMHSPETDETFKLLNVARLYFGHGTVRRIPHTLPPLVFAALRLARQVHQREVTEGAELEVTSKKVFHFIHQTCTALADSAPEMAVKLFLQGAQLADSIGLNEISYEFFARVFLMYEDVADSKVQLRLLRLIIGTLHCCRQLDESSYAGLITRATKQSAKLLEKPAQCRMVCLCAHLFWAGDPSQQAASAAEPEAAADDALMDESTKAGSAQVYRQPRRVLECLQRALRIADTCVPMSSQLFITILNHYIFFFEQRCEAVETKFITGLVKLVRDHIASMANDASKVEAQAHFDNSLQHIRQQCSTPEGKAIYGDIQLD